ncbi:hypothetical protein M422DRAFT_24524 [Sphaerobolus stellatus SS14]|nr:hypothetical protein M422DRAFT_24524 [Sphaerobolus stellatus SS14]
MTHMLATSTVHRSPPKPGWYTEELDEEWIEPEISAIVQESQEASSPRQSRSIQSQGNISIISNNNANTSLQEPSSPPAQGTFVVREDQAPTPILVIPPGQKKGKNAMKDFFSPLALETMFEPPSPKLSSQELPEQQIEPEQPEYYESVAEQSEEPEQSFGEADMEEETRPFVEASSDEPEEGEDVIVASDIPNLASFDGRKPSSHFKFTFSANCPPRVPSVVPEDPSPSHTPNWSPMPAQSQPQPQPPATDPRLRLFHFQYDTFTREHLSAIVDSIAVHTPSDSSDSKTPHNVLSQSRTGNVSTDDSYLRATKRLRLTPPSNTSQQEEPEPKQRRDYIGESRNLMNKIRQARTPSMMTTISAKENVEPTFIADQSTVESRPRRIPTSDLRSIWFSDSGSNSSARHGSPAPSSSLQPSSAHLSTSLHPIYPNSTLTPSMPSSLYSSSSGSKPSTIASALGYRRQAADLMAQIRMDMKTGKRLFSLETAKGSVEDEGENGPLHVSVTPASPGSTQHLTIPASQRSASPQQGAVPRKLPGRSPRKLLLRLSAADEVDRELAMNKSVSDTSLQDIPPVQSQTIAPFSIQSASEPIQAFHVNISPPTLADIQALRPPSTIGETNRVVSSGTSASVETADSAMTRGTTATSATSVITVRSSSSGSMVSAPSFVKHPGPVQMTRITPQDMPPLPDTVGGMRFDHVLMRWIKAMPSKENEDVEAGLTAVSEESEDPFRDFESLRSGDDEPTNTHMQANSFAEAFISDDDTFGDEQHMQPIAAQVVDTDTDDSFDFDAESRMGVVEVMTGEVSTDPETTDSENDFRGEVDPVPESADEDEDATATLPKRDTTILSNVATANISTSLGSHRVVEPPRSVLKNATPALKTPRNLHRSHRRSVSFSDGRREGKILGLGEDEGPSPLLPAGPILDDLPEPSFVNDTPSRQPSLGESSSSRRMFARSTKERDLSMAQGNQTFLTECSFGVARDNLVHIITDAHPYMPYWETLEEVDLSGKGIESVARLKEFLPRLDALNLDNNALSWLTGIPRSLRALSVSSNLLTAMTSFNQLLNLEVLDISNNQIDSLQQLSCLRHLRELKADGNAISSLDGLSGLSNLRKLSLKGNHLCHIKFEEMNWPRMELVNLSRNRIREISGIGTVGSLCALNLDHNQLGSIEGEDSQPKLRTLRISSNRLTRLDVSSFVNVRTLYADNNKLGDIVGVKRLRRLENLSLRNQGGAGLSLRVHDIRDVKRLYLSGNPLSREFLNEACYHLVYLELAGCRITELPANLAQLIPNVRVLNLNYNFLVDGRALDGLTRLRKLTLIGSRLKGTKSLVRMLKRMPEIEMLDFRMNPCTLGWYLPILVQDVPSALQPSEEGFGGGEAAAMEFEGGLRPGRPYGHGGGGAGSRSHRASWQELDAKFRCDLPDEAYVGRLAYRGLVMRACPRIKMLDGVLVESGEREKAERLLEGVMIAKQA